jgi:hypothetical protein
LDEKLVEAVMQVEMVQTELIGQARLPYNNSTTTCAVLSQAPQQDDRSCPCLVVPLTDTKQLKLLEFTKFNQTQSKPVLLGLNSLLVNRDNALFDNLPWALWSVDPSLRNRDAAGNPIERKYHFGKRDAYNRFMGKDWQGQSLALGNLALRAKYTLTVDDSENDDSFVLMQRILQLQLQEREMDLAQLDQELAIRVSQQQDTAAWDDQRLVFAQALEETRRRLEDLNTQTVQQSSLSNWLDDIAEGMTADNVAPYRGATGYAPLLDSRENVENAATYASPYHFLLEMLEDQLNAKVLGAVLENASLLQGTLSLGGVLILRRMTATKTLTIAGETLSVNDEEEEFGNEGIKGGETFVVECDADEAIGISMACQVPLSVETDIWNRASVMAEPLKGGSQPTGPVTVRTVLPLFKTSDPELSVLREGQASNRSTTERTLPIRIPATTTSLFDRMFEQGGGGGGSSTFPTDNPIETLSEYDALSNQEKAKTLLELSNFNDRLPRPRVVRQQPDALDKLLIPLVDESVRRQYMIRDAERQGDTVRVQELQATKSKRQVAKEQAELAREAGSLDVAERWEEEAELYSNLRADVTQDEGTYSRFLDRDDWYDRTRAIQAKKLDKKKFGTLLDGIE